MFSQVRAVLETEDGTLHMATKFVAAAGGCGAMQAKDPDAETVELGKMIVKTFPPALSSSPIWSGLVMIKHPNHTACSSTSTPPTSFRSCFPRHWRIGGGTRTRTLDPLIKSLFPDHNPSTATTLGRVLTYHFDSYAH